MLAVQCALALLLGHELGTAHEQMHAGNACRAEEAFCQAYPLSFLESALSELPVLSPLERQEHPGAPGLTEVERVSVLEAARSHVAAGLPGYRDGAAISGEAGLFDELVELLDHAGTDNAEDLVLLADLARRTLHWRDVPVRMIVTPGSAYERNEWMLVGTQYGPGASQRPKRSRPG